MTTIPRTRRSAAILATTAVTLLTLWGGGARGAEPAAPTQGGASGGSPGIPSGDGTVPVSGGRITHNGVTVTFEARPAGEKPGQRLVAGRPAEVRFTLAEEGTGKPIRGNVPGAWMDIGEPAPGRADASQKPCKDKLSLYLKGAIGFRPMIDLNSYHVLVLNSEPSISVVDPLVSMAGQTSTLGTIPLKSPGIDWALSADSKRLYVSMPKAGAVAVVDTAAFRAVATVEAGTDPTRVALSPDGRTLWVANDARAEDSSGVTVVDVATLKPVARLATGAGHHEIAFSPDGRFAFVTSRSAGTVSVIDAREPKILRTVKTGPQPISLAYSGKADALYVADGREGTVSVLDGKTHAVAATIRAKPGLGPLRFTPDGRFALLANPARDAVLVLDAAENVIAHEIPVKGKPYQIVLTRSFAYVRALDSERVTMINLSSIGRSGPPIVQSFAAGAEAPGKAGDLPLAESIAGGGGEAAALVVSPAENATYFYMEGMNAPSSSYKVRGATARAVAVVERNLREVEPGVYASNVIIPVAGRYDVAFLLSTPQIFHCFSAEAAADPAADPASGGLDVEYLAADRVVKAGADVPVRFRLRDKRTGAARTGIADVTVLVFRAPGKDRTEMPAREIGDGVYEASLPLAVPGAYRVHVGARSLRVGYDDLPYFSLAAAADPAGKPTAPKPPEAAGSGGRTD